VAIGWEGPTLTTRASVDYACADDRILQNAFHSFIPHFLDLGMPDRVPLTVSNRLARTSSPLTGSALSVPEISEPPSRSIQWLVSIRSWQEFLAVSAVTSDIIDFKEPRLGPMAATQPSLWSQAINAYNDRAAALSVALGDWQSAVSIAASVPAGIRFAKMGGEGLGTVDELDHRLGQVRKNLLSEVELVPVAYADHQAAASVDVESVIELCMRRGDHRLLVDTFDKKGVSSLKCLGINRWRQIVTAARETGVWLSLAGGISLDDARDIVSDPTIRPDCVGIRGAICGKGRESSVCATRLAQWHAWHNSDDSNQSDVDAPTGVTSDNR
jgi:(5-formylfuran-3-yl)methyl phosphate synthase